MAGWFYNPPPPQPAAVHVPPNVAAASNIPPNPIGPGSLLIRSLWPPESWPSQVLIGGGVGALTAAVFTPPVAVAAANPNVLATILRAWPPEQWFAQRAAQIASLFAGAATGPIAYPSPPASLRSLRGLWPPESWYAQSEGGIAAGLAQTQLPAVYTPNWYGDTLLQLVSTWPLESWAAQTGPKSAGWYPKPALYTPRPVPHWEWQQWPPEQWNSQTGARIAPVFSIAPSALPYVNQWLAASLRSTWPPEDWRPQTFPDITPGTPPSAAPLPRAPSQFPISLWPIEFWGSQPGTRAAAILASPQLLIFMPYVVGELEIVAIAQLQSLFAPVITIQYVFSGAPPLTVVDQSIPRGTLVFPGEALTLQVSLGRRHGPAPCPVVESIVVSNIPVVLSILPPNKTVIH